MTISILDEFSKIDFSEYPDFHEYNTPLERGLWVLWVAKDKLEIKSLTADLIALIIVEILEVSITANSIKQSFNKAKNKIHTYPGDKNVNYGIMKVGKEYLLSKNKNSIELCYFEPEKPYTSKNILSKDILGSLKGELSIIDPYCGKRTLDILKCSDEKKKIRLITKINNLNKNKKDSFIREFRDFKIEYPHIEIRDYSKGDIHDRYIISDDSIVFLGHSIKNLGNTKESFANIVNNNDVHKLLIKNFNDRWSNSSSIV
jgi:hypothetical protein